MTAAPTPPTSSGGGRLRTRILALALVAAALLAAFYSVLGLPHRIIGDGREYVCMAASWVDLGKPFVPPVYLLSCSQHLNPDDPQPLGGYFPLNGSFESAHFWFLSLLAAPFVSMARAWDIHTLQSFTLLHACLAVLTAARILWRLNLPRALIVLALAASSPLIFWANKAHSEFFVCCALLLAFTEIAAGSLLWAALWIAIAATQQSTLSIAAVALMAAVFIRTRGAVLRGRQLILALSVLAVLSLSPLWYLYRINKLSYLGFSVDPNLISVHRAVSLFIDPDIGLFPAWPIGLALLILAAIFARRNQVLAISALAFCVLEPALVAIQPNWNAGGTYHISRYAIYLMPPLVLAGTEFVTRRVALAAAPLLLAYQLVWNVPTFTPGKDQDYLFRTPFANWLYSNHPGWYDPEPEVFSERTFHIDGLTPRMIPPGVWAAHTENCAKVLVMRDPGQEPRMCPEVAAELRSGKSLPNARGYINRR